MKTEQEQIKAIADVLCDYCKNNTKVGEPCKSSNGTYICTSEIRRAAAIVQAGYGDISKYKSELLQTKCNDLKELSDWQREEIKRLKAETSNIRKDTAKEILQTLYDQCYEINDETGDGMGNFVPDDDILCLAKHYGVEVDV